MSRDVPKEDALPQRRFVVRDGRDLGAAIAELRHDAGLTQSAFAERAGLSRSYLSKLEAGRTTKLLDHLLRAIRRAGGTVTVTWNADR